MTLTDLFFWRSAPPRIGSRARLIAEHRARCVAMILAYEEALDRACERYGAPRGWRRPGSKTPAERIAELDREIASIA
jgi:hypothetical protein